MRTVQLLRKLDPAEWGGTEMAMHRLFDGLKEQGVSAIVYCPRTDKGTIDEDDPLVRSGHDVQRFNAFIPVLGISETRRRQMIAVGGNIMSFDLVSSLWREQDISLIHSHALGRIGAIGRTVARRKQVPFILTIHGGVLDLPENVKKSFNAPEPGWEWGKVFGLLFQSHRLLQDADAILTCNAKEAALLREKFPGKRIVVQPHGIEPEKFETDCRAEARQAYPQICARTMLLSLGRVDPIKNQAWLLEQMPAILQKHPDVLLVLAGACTDEPYGVRINETIRRFGLENKVILTGGLPPGDPRLIGLLQEARAIVLPSLSETFGLVILEAWAAGAMVLSSRTSGASALIEDGKNGWLFDVGQPQTFIEVLNRTLHDPTAASAMARCGAEKVRSNYTLNGVASSVKRLYEELVEEKQCVT
jgi:glycosyltransferase involved in cell wall biosynthesis